VKSGLWALVCTSIVFGACTEPNPAYRPRANVGDRGDGAGTSRDSNDPVDAGLSVDRAPPPDGVAEYPPAIDAGEDLSVPVDGPSPAETPPVDATPPAPDVAPPAPDVAPPPPDMGPVEPLPGNLRLHWKFDGSGSTVADSSGRNLTGTLQMGATLVPGRTPAAGKAVRLDGVRAHVIPEATLATGALPAVDGEKTIALWINPTDRNHTGMQTILGLANDDDAIQVGTDRGRPACWQSGDDSGEALITFSQAAPPGWYHVAYTFKGGVHAFYVNGVLQGTTVDADQQDGPTETFVVGTYSTTDFPFEMYEGLIDDLRIYDKALDATQIGIIRMLP
jgi:hypothetical protein